MDLRGNIPTVIRITHGKVADNTLLDELVFEAGAFYIMDRGYLDFARLHVLTQSGAFFVTRARRILDYRRVVSRPVDKTTGLRCDQTIVLCGQHTRHRYPSQLRRIRYVDPTSGMRLTFLTNNFVLDAYTITQLYRSRWQVELFFKWIKQHLHIKAFYGTSENAVKTQIWIAISVYVLVAIVKKRLHLEASHYTILQILSVVLFEKTPILQALSLTTHHILNEGSSNQLNLFDI
jgi:transposase